MFMTVSALHRESWYFLAKLLIKYDVHSSLFKSVSYLGLNPKTTAPILRMRFADLTNLDI